MAVEDVLSQIQDLQTTIENFTACENTGTINNQVETSTSKKRDSKTLIFQPDEKTFVEDTEDTGKILVESLTTSPAATAGTSLDQVSIRFSNDFSSLVDHFSALRERLDSEKWTTNDEKALVDLSGNSSSNANASRSLQEEALIDKRSKETQVNQHEQCNVQDKLQVESDDNHTPTSSTSQPAILVIANDNTPSMYPSIESQSHHYYHQHMHSMPTSPLSACIATPKSRMSTTSRRSRRPSTLSKKSSKSSRYFAKHKKESTTVEYTARSYDEMMRIPDPRERLAFYEKTFKQCIRADSKLTSWMKRVKEKGLPTPMTEGYKPPPRPRTPDEAEQSKGTLHGNGSTSSLSGSISMFLKKASASSTLGRRTFGETTPRPSMSRLFLPTSLSRLSLSKSSRQPKVAPEHEPPLPDYDFNRYKRPPPPMSGAAQKPPRPAATMSATTSSSMGTNRWRTSANNNHASRHKKTKKKRSTDSMSSTTTSTTTSPARSISSSFSKLSRLSHRQSVATLNSTTIKSKQQEQYHGESSVDAVVAEMCNTLPHMERRVIEEYLAEAGGDQMVAITLAMSQLKRPTTQQSMYHHC
ncbi:hypothetical protein K492DRAFT_192708 [Lichtheimia hyalospora FSU 10163]|nr:hypothetical protein K492DRAFT_192708 [Lichtheimia hyalospora FSU 10163]